MAIDISMGAIKTAENWLITAESMLKVKFIIRHCTVKKWQ